MAILNFLLKREKKENIKRTYVASLRKKAYRLWKGKKIKEAVRCIGKIATSPFPEERDRIFYYLGEFDKVTEGFNMVYYLDCRSSYEWNKTGVDLACMENYDEALICFEKALDGEPYYAKAWYNRAMALKRQGNFEEAIRSFHIAILINPYFSEALREKEKTENYLVRKGDEGYE